VTPESEWREWFGRLKWIRQSEGHCKREGSSGVGTVWAENRCDSPSVPAAELRHCRFDLVAAVFDDFNGAIWRWKLVLSGESDGKSYWDDRQAQLTTFTTASGNLSFPPVTRVSHTYQRYRLIRRREDLLRLSHSRGSETVNKRLSLVLPLSTVELRIIAAGVSPTFHWNVRPTCTPPLVVQFQVRSDFRPQSSAVWPTLTTPIQSVIILTVVRQCLTELIFV